MKLVALFPLVLLTLCITHQLLAGTDCSKAETPGQCADCCSYQFTANLKQELDSKCSQVAASKDSKDRQTILSHMEKAYELSSRSLSEICEGYSSREEQEEEASPNITSQAESHEKQTHGSHASKMKKRLSFKGCLEKCKNSKK